MRFIKHTSIFALCLGLALSINTTSLAGDKHEHGSYNGKKAGTMHHDMPDFDMKNPKHAVAGILSAGQPSASDFEKLSKHGYANVINLRGEDEFTEFDEAQMVNELGMNYISLPISSRAEINFENAEKLDQILQQTDGKTIIHCGSGNRVGALIALRAYHVQNMSKEDAVALGVAAGLTSLKSTVEEVLSKE